MTAKFTLPAAIFAVLLACAAGAHEPQSVVVEVSWHVSIAADGHVEALSTTDTEVPKLHERLEKAIRGWRFGAGQINGITVPTETTLQTHLRISVVDDHFEVRLVSAGTGGGYRMIHTPTYPDYAARRGKTACVMLKVNYDETGRVVDAGTYSTSKNADPQFVDAALSSVKMWTFEPELVGGHARMASALVPIMFELSGKATPLCPHTDDGSGNGSGQMFALNPAAKLQSDVIGRTL